MRFHGWVKDKRRTKRAKRAAEERAERGEMIPVHDLEDEAPFGIRALLEAPEVEGVWNSREATPMQFDGASQTPLPTEPSNIHPNQSSNSSTLYHDATDLGLSSPTGI